MKKATVVVGDIAESELQVKGENSEDDGILMKEEDETKKISEVQLKDGFVLRNVDFEAKPGTVCLLPKIFTFPVNCDRWCCRKRKNNFVTYNPWTNSCFNRKS